MTELLHRLQADVGPRYAFDRELGRGGMARVFLAHDRELERPVAIKVLDPDLSATVGAERFEREIRIASRLQHPNILPLYGSGKAAGLMFYVMPYVDGETLRQRMDRERQLPVEEALRIAGEIAAALDHAHRDGLIHRDVKPENILLQVERTYVADFGIARAIMQSSGDRMTQTGVALGTPTYMSPEQAAAERHLDGRADQYSLACVLYEMLMGQPPFVGPNVHAILAQHALGIVPSLSVIRHEIPANVEEAIHRALSKDPAHRFRNEGEFAAALRGELAVRKRRGWFVWARR